MSVLCKACGKPVGDAKKRRLLSGRVYSALFEVGVDEHCSDTSVTATQLHSFLSSEPSYVCKPCYATLDKYAKIKEELSAIRTHIIDACRGTSTSEQTSPSVRSALLNYN